MFNVEHGYSQGPTAARRTEDDRKRRRAIAAIATGLKPDTGEVEEEAVGVERFRCVIYLCAAPNSDITATREECTAYAEAYGWGITAVIEDRATLQPPRQRDGLAQAVERVQNREAGAVLTACRSMISPVPQEYDEVARTVETAGGFLHLMAPGPHHTSCHADPC